MLSLIEVAPLTLLVVVNCSRELSVTARLQALLG
jgi:hypothetical protein